jgi:hypothetical protein
MLIDFRKPILDISGEPIVWRPEQRDPTGKVTKPEQKLTMLSACQEALGAAFSDEQTTLSQKEKIERFSLALRIANPMPVEITLDEAGEIKKCVNKLFGGSVILPRVAEIFEAATKADAKSEIKAVA